MGIKIRVSDRVRFKVATTLNDETGKPQAIEFWLIAKRLNVAALTELMSKPFEDLVRQVVVDWSDVVEVVDGGSAQEGIDELLSIPGMAMLIARTYVSETGAKEKN